MEVLAEAVGFEPTVPFGTTVFKTASLSHSDTPPHHRAVAAVRRTRRTGYHIPLRLWGIACFAALRGGCLRGTAYNPSMNEHRTPEEQQALDAQYMALALEEARAAGAAGEVPIGAVVVYEPIDRGTRRPLAEPRVIARGRNRREADRDPAGHAEFLAMKEAARVLDAWRLTDCTVYVTLEPCIMCAGLMHQARIARCVYGAPDQKAGAVGTLYDIHADGRLNHQFEVTGGVREEECVALLRGFFRARRKKPMSNLG